MSNFFKTLLIQKKSPQGASNIDLILNFLIIFGNSFLIFVVLFKSEPGPDFEMIEPQ